MCKKTDLKIMNYVNSSIYKNIFAQIFSCMKVYASKYVHECIRVYINIYVYIYINIYTYEYV